MKVFDINFSGILDDSERNKFKREQVSIVYM